MPTVRLLSGLKTGEEIEVGPDVAQAFVASGKAELVTSEPVDTPERGRPRGETRARTRKSTAKSDA